MMISQYQIILILFSSASDKYAFIISAWIGIQLVENLKEDGSGIEES